MSCKPLAALLVVFALTHSASGQSPVDARWIWADEGDPAVEAAPGKVWFRHEVRAEEPSTGSVRIACDDRFTLWVNGQEVGSGGGGECIRYNLNGIVERGANVIAVEAENKEGKAGLLVEGEVRGQSGKAVSFDSGPAWRATRETPNEGWIQPRFDTAAWQAAKDLGPHDDSPWREISFKETYLDRYQTPPGFAIQRIGEPELVGSLVAITWGNRGRLIASPEKKPIQSLIDENGDGVFDKAVEYSPAMTNCQGLCTIGDVLWAVGDGPQGTGMYRLPDADGDDKADSVELVTGYKGKMGEHGPHDIVLGPDGWLYHNLGNHAWITSTPEPTSPIRDYYEGDLLRPRYEDPNGHAAGIPAPGGTVWRFSPDGKKWYLHTNGFRNHYDIAFNQGGDLFTFDSDMEWEVGMPFYKPVRVAHCTAGAEFGWRSNAGKWMEYYIDSLPSAADVGRGSPTGIAFYEHEQFPEKYRGALIASDWSMGRILAVHLTPDGASYKGDWEVLVSGNPLNVSDVEVDRDGSLIFATGGRGTEGGVYRLSYVADANVVKKTQPFALAPLFEALAMPQPSAGWSRERCRAIKKELGDEWQAGLAKAAVDNFPARQVRALALLSQHGPRPELKLLVGLTRDPDAQVRATAAGLLGDHSTPRVAAVLGKLLADPDPLVQRRACDAFVHSGLEAPAEPLISLLASQDRFVRFAARIALERVPVEKWRDRILAADDLQVALHGMLALHRIGATSPADALAKEIELWDRASQDKDSQGQVDVLRLIELSLIAGVEGPAVAELGERLLAAFPVGDSASPQSATDAALNMELSRILAFLQVPEAAAETVDALEQTKSQSLAIHYALATSYLKAGWDYDLNRRLLAWYDTTQSWEGGHSFPRWLENIMTAHLTHYPPSERRQLLESWSDRPFASRLLLRASDPAAIEDYEEVMRGLVADLEARPGQPGGEEMVGVAIDALSKSTTPIAQEALRRLFDDLPDRRDQIARGMAMHPSAENWAYLVRSLDFADNTTLQLVIAALRGLELKPDKPSQVRSAILAGLKLGDAGGLTAASLLEHWSGEPFDANASAAAALGHYQALFHERHPNEPPAELTAADAGKTKYTYQQLYDHLEASAAGKQGDVARGKAIYTKANCVKCHKFSKEGEGVGPDLTTVRRRFQRREIIESLVAPSQVISDQYRSVTLQTIDGQIHIGMPLPNQGEDKVVLLMPDAKKLEVPRDQIDEMSPAKVSVMPEGVLKELTLEDIADLFAFLETSKQNPEPPKAERAGAGR